ncbi:hypothetical protein Q6346_07515 [Isoptericola sp. b490]|uniref:hypothetical protein n=1 Tax=Actinotalea lenta TaxID=3064654 RepID=UPI0027136728|nr:hypothetical protein [Isoptericola sp. b490]MDO8121159.1 hypothetical protein [Isoptericola sp. b490]
MRRKHLTVLALAFGLGALVAAPTAGAAPTSPDGTGGQAAQRAERVHARSVDVDLRTATDEQLAALADLDADVTINVTGIDVASPAERRAADAAVAKQDAAREQMQRPTVGETQEKPCPDLPTGDRSPDGSTTPTVRCGTDGTMATLAPVTGEPGTSMSAAVDAVLAAWFPGEDLGTTTVTRTGGGDQCATVSLPIVIS